ncbi:hypothetical protein [Bacteroides nordii]|uniref:hypothetical protein n=1 Tax=Bacteroides nordii TaxID=291645 RepID=UPI0026DCE5D8|nr:hypothetical protein [Bacteroides nordii]
MKKFLYLILLCGGFSCFIACEDEAKNPGDFNLKSELKVISVSTKSGKTFDVKVLRSIDTTYVRSYEKKDTLKDAEGNYILAPDGSYQIEKTDIFYEGGITAKYTEIEKMLLDANADTINIDMESNAKWNAPIPSSGGRLAWFFTQKLAGGGDATVRASVTHNTGKTRKVDAAQYILTGDSTVMYKLVFGQVGEKD